MTGRVITALLLGVLWTTGCSKKGEECPVIAGVSDAFGKSLSEVRTDGYTLKEIATIRQASVSAQQKAKKLKELKLTDEQLAAMQKATVTRYEQAAGMLKEMSDTFTAAADAAQQKIKVAKGLDGARAAVKEACDKKEKKKKLRRKKRKECKKVDAAMEGLPTGDLTDEQLQTGIDDLGKLTVSVEDVKTALDNVVANLKGQIEASKGALEAQKKADATKTRLEDQKKQDADFQTKLKAYCAAD